MGMTAAAAVLRESANTRTSLSHMTTHRRDTKMSRRVSVEPRHFKDTTSLYRRRCVSNVRVASAEERVSLYSGESITDRYFRLVAVPVSLLVTLTTTGFEPSTSFVHKSGQPLC